MIETLSICRGNGTDPYRNLATERYLTLHARQGECVLYLWQNQRTVVIGRNQNCWKECRVHALEEDGGHLARRLSGGGAVYHDSGNLNFSFCVREGDYDVARQLSVIVEAARVLGIAAEQTGRNDVTADGKKFSGNAFYRTDGFCCHHGTLLVDADKAGMERYLNVSRGKLETKGVDSVRSRVVNLRELNPEVSVDRLREQMIQAAEQVYGCPALPFGAERFDMDELGVYEAFFASWDWKYGKKLEFQHSMGRRFPWGEIELRFRVDGGIVREAQAISDAMDHAFIEELPALWRGRRYEADELARALEDFGRCGGADVRPDPEGSADSRPGPRGFAGSVSDGTGDPDCEKDSLQRFAGGVSDGMGNPDREKDSLQRFAGGVSDGTDNPDSAADSRQDFAGDSPDRTGDLDSEYGGSQDFADIRALRREMCRDIARLLCEEL